MSTAIQVDGVSKKFRLYHERFTTLKERVIHFSRAKHEDFWALRNVDLEIEAGETMGLLGANGSGKTTLLKVIAGILRPTSGSVVASGRIAALLELGAGFHPDLTGRENVYMNASILGLTRKETNRYFDEIVQFAELAPFIDNQVKHYSSGMYVRLGFAVAVHVSPDILLVDEVLAVGDEAFQRKCLDKVRSFQKEGRTIVFVTHAVEIVRDICTRAAYLRHGELESVGPTPEVVRLFRDALHGDAHLEAAPMQERGNRAIRIMSVGLLDDGGRPRQMYHAGDDLEVVIDLEAEEPVADPIIGVAVYDEQDRHIFGTNTAHRNISIKRLHGKLRVRFALRALPLLEGSYSISIGVHDRDERVVYHWQEKTYPFRCVNTGADAGPFHIECEIEMEPL